MKFQIVKHINQDKSKKIEKLRFTILFVNVLYAIVFGLGLESILLEKYLGNWIIFILIILPYIIWFYLSTFPSSQRIKTFEISCEFNVTDDWVEFSGKKYLPNEFELNLFDKKGKWLLMYGPYSDGTKNELYLNGEKLNFIIENDNQYSFIIQKIIGWKKNYPELKSKYFL